MAVSNKALFKDLATRLPSVAVHRQGRVLHHIVHRQVLEPPELRPTVSPPQFEEEEQSDDDGSDDEG